MGSSAALKVCLDVNIWVAYLMALQWGRQGTVVAQVVEAVRDMKVGAMPLQLVMSQEMLGTLERVLDRQGFNPPAVQAFVQSIEDLMRRGPEGIEPHLLVSGRDQLAMHDREDAGVLAASFLARVDLLVTDNLKDFETNDSETFNTQEVARPSRGTRQLTAIVHERADGVALVVAHPFDVIEWLKKGVRPTPEAIRKEYGSVLDQLLK